MSQSKFNWKPFLKYFILSFNLGALYKIQVIEIINIVKQYISNNFINVGGREINLGVGCGGRGEDDAVKLPRYFFL